MNELNVQRFLRQNPLDGMEQLNELYGIKSTFHEELPLVILNYDMIKSPKTHKIVRECRGLTLEVGSYDVVAKSFDRFFNLGEVESEMRNFDFSDFRTESKEDGSMMLLYYYDGWKLNSRGTFGDGRVQFSDYTWIELFCKSLGIEELGDVDHKLADDYQPSRNHTYVFELVSPYNKIVRLYKEPKSYLLTVLDNNTFVEHSLNDIENCATSFRCHRPETYKFSSIGQIKKFLKDKGAEDPTFEGVVICDSHGHRWKIKTPEYLALHRMKGNNNVFNLKNMIPFILSGEDDELLTYFPEIEDEYKKAWGIFHWELHKLNRAHEESKNIEDQKEFAIYISKKTKLTPILFEARKTGKDPESILRDKPDFVLKFIFGKK